MDIFGHQVDGSVHLLSAVRCFGTLRLLNKFNVNIELINTYILIEK